MSKTVKEKKPRAKKIKTDNAFDEVLTENSSIAENTEVEVPVLTALLPLMNMNKIAWLAMESLCNQQNIDFKWELIIHDEVGDTFATKEVMDKYAPRLAAIGCVNIVVKINNEHITLGQKWHEMAKDISKSSVCSLLIAGDCYSQPKRLADTYRVLSTENYDVYTQAKGIFFNIAKEPAERKNILFDKNFFEHPTGLNIAYKSDFFREIPFNEVPKNIDFYLYQCLKSYLKRQPLIYLDNSENWKGGLDTNGCNQISKQRVNYFANTLRPFFKTNIKLRSKIENAEILDLPPYIVDALLLLCEQM